MPTRRITFETPKLVEGSIIPNITVEGVTVTFLTRVAIFRPDVPTESGVKALRNAGQATYDETGFQKPIIFEFSHLQNRVRLSAGLNERDISTHDGRITARLVAYDSSGREINSASQNLGSGPASITNTLEVRAPSSRDVIRRVLLEYNGLVREVIDDLEFQSRATSPIPRDTDPPVVSISRPAQGQQVNSRTIMVSGRIRELNDVRLVINAVPFRVQRIDAINYFFIGEITLAEGESTIEAVATDEAGNTGADRKTVDVRIPARFSKSNVRFTQTGLFDTASPLATPRVARKTSLFCVRLEIVTSDGLPTSVDAVEIVVEGGRSSQSFSGQPRPSSSTHFGGSGYYPVADGQDAYFFINGRWLEPGYAYRFILKLRVRQQVVFEETLVSDWSFQNIRGITMLIIPQHRPLESTATRALMEVLDNASRIFPVPDGVANLASDQVGGIRVAILPPVSYRGHTDPADNSLLGTSVIYLQGFLLHDHSVASPGGRLTLWSGEYLPIEFTHAEDENRNGVLDPEELAHVAGGEARESKRRFENWSTFVRETAESLRQFWNGFVPRYYAQRAIAVVTKGGENAQNRTGLGGDAGGGERSYWATIDGINVQRSSGDIVTYEFLSNGFITHETGHTFGFPHAEDTVPPTETSCQFPVEAINLLTRRIINPAYSVMCPGLAGGSSILYLHQEQYNMLFNRLVSMGGID